MPYRIMEIDLLRECPTTYAVNLVNVLYLKLIVIHCDFLDLYIVYLTLGPAAVFY